ncbi:glycosyltransferase [Klebsiella aerogenes]
MKAINPDILHCITIKPGIISCLWAKYHKTKLVYSFVGLGRVFESEQLVF